MFNISKIIIWICKRFNREQVTLIIEELSRILKDPNSEIQPKDSFREDHPNYRNYEVDPNPPLKKNPRKKKGKKTTTCS